MDGWECWPRDGVGCERRGFKVQNSTIKVKRAANFLCFQNEILLKATILSKYFRIYLNRSSLHF